MNKLSEWVIGINVLSTLWLIVFFEMYDKNISQTYFFIIQFLPIILIIILGIMSLIIILYRVVTFNDCELAAKELKEEIKEAKIALKKKGFKYD